MSPRVACAIGFAGLAAIFGGCDVDQVTVSPTVRPGEALEQAEVVRSVDGDTIIVRIDGREERLRYIGIDAPESVSPGRPVECFGPEASDANERLVDRSSVFLEADLEDRDQFGRLLRYVYVRDQGDKLRMVNQYLVEQGYAEAGSYPPNDRYQDELFAAERDARDGARGLWGACR